MKIEKKQQLLHNSEIRTSKWNFISASKFLKTNSEWQNETVFDQMYLYRLLFSCKYLTEIKEPGEPLCSTDGQEPLYMDV